MRGTQFRELINMLRAELGVSLSRSTGLNTIDAQKYALQNTYQWLYESFDWRFLKVTREEPLMRNSRYYSFHEDLSFEGVEKVWCLHGDEWLPVHFGIDESHYSQYSETEQLDPVQRWDAHDDDQFEVWPTPASNGVLRMYGTRKFRPLRDEHDICLIDDLLVVFFTAARAAGTNKTGRAAMLIEAANSRLRHLRAKSRARKTRPFVMGGGGQDPVQRLRPGIDYIASRG